MFSNGTPLQYSCLENPMDGGAWWAVVCGVAKSWTLFTFMNGRRKWQPTPVFLPGESQGWGILVGCCLWGLYSFLLAVLSSGDAKPLGSDCENQCWGMRGGLCVKCGELDLSPQVGLRLGFSSWTVGQMQGGWKQTRGRMLCRAWVQVVRLLADHQTPLPPWQEW